MEVKSQHLAPQKREFVQERTFYGKLARLTLTASWGLMSNRHQFLLHHRWEVPNGYGGWVSQSHGPASKETLEELWPEFVGAQRYHGCSLKGPLYYIENTVFLAGTRDFLGWEPGEHRKAKESGLPLWKADTDELFSVVESLEQPQPLELRYEPLLVEKRMTWGPNKGIPIGQRQLDDEGRHLWRIPGHGFPMVRSVEEPAPRVYAFKPYLGEGKARELELARRSAIWLDATDEELSVSSEALKAALEARLPQLLMELKGVVERFGMTF